MHCELGFLNLVKLVQEHGAIAWERRGCACGARYPACPCEALGWMLRPGHEVGIRH